jgi:hypothetical protein
MVANLNRTRVLKFLELFYARDTEGALARCSEDVELFASAPTDILPHMGHRRGKDDVRKTWQTVHAPSTRCAPGASPTSARSSTPTIWSSRCWNATSALS